MQPIAASFLVQTLYGARYARPDLLRAISLLARKMTKWRPMQDLQLHRFVCYLKSTLSHRQYAWVGDSKENLTLHLYTDADLASELWVQGPTCHWGTAASARPLFHIAARI